MADRARQPTLADPGQAEGRIRQALIEENLLDGLVGLPAQLFPSTGIPVCIVLFDRAREKGGARNDADDVFFIDTSRDFVPGKKQNQLGDAQLDRIVATWQARENVERYAAVVPRAQLAENGYNLTFPVTSIPSRRRPRSTSRPFSRKSSPWKRSWRVPARGWTPICASWGSSRERRDHPLYHRGRRDAGPAARDRWHGMADAGADGRAVLGDELLARIRDIRSSEKQFYKNVLEIYATSIDCDPKAEASATFFKTVQNKMHYAAHGHTAAEIVHARADPAKDHMGLTSWAAQGQGGLPRKSDAGVATNYLGDGELEPLTCSS